MPITSNLRKELKKILPTGASQNKRCTEPTIPKKKQNILEKRRFTLEDQLKYTNPALCRYLEEHFKIDDLQSKSPFALPSTVRKVSQGLPKYSLTPDRSPEKIQKQLTKKFENETNFSTPLKKNSENFRSSQNLLIINGIMDACDEVKSPKHVINPKNVRKFTGFVKKVIDDIDDVLIGNPEALNNRVEDHRGFKEFLAKQGLKKLVIEKNERKKIFYENRGRTVSEQRNFLG
jgi:hypothetical protein